MFFFFKSSPVMLQMMSEKIPVPMLLPLAKATQATVIGISAYIKSLHARLRGEVRSLMLYK